MTGKHKDFSGTLKWSIQVLEVVNVTRAGYAIPCARARILKKFHLLTKDH